ncbi:MAG: aldo/keto reductase, partial [Thermoplasmata archaeon]|nr:aldo/keto reductase [Thermoplasmata archaeon]
MPAGESTAFDLSRGLETRTRLHDGTSMPILGLGVWQAPPGAATRNAVTYALESGYRLVDTASLYQNEADVGAAIRGSEIDRDEIFVTTKLWNDDQGYEPALKAFERSLRTLGLAEVDLYLVHWPVSELRSESWRALVRIQREGRCTSIGVSNFTVAHLRELRERSDVLPVVNQVEFHPFLYQPELLDYCKQEGIQLEAYSPLARGRRLQDATLAAIAQAHRRTPAQVMLRWGLQHGVVEIPKSV